MEEIGTLTAPSTEIAPVTETPEIETTETPTTEEGTPEGGTPTDEGGETPAEDALPGDPGEGETIETDARTMDKATRETIAALKKTNPVAAKLLAKQFYGRQAYEKEFPTVQEARQAKATIESLGGQEGITNLQNEVTDYRTEIEQFANGERGLIEQLHKGNPESVIKAAENIIDLLTETRNADAIDRLLMKPMVERLDGVGFGRTLASIAKLLEEGKGQDAYNTLAQLGEWYSKIKGESEKMASTRVAKDPAKEALAKEREAFQKEKYEHETRALSNEVTRVNNGALSKVLDPFFKTMKMPNDGRKEFTQQVMNKVWDKMRADKIYMRDAGNKRRAGDSEATTQFISAKFSELLPEVFRNYRNSMYPNLVHSPAATSKPNGQPPTNGKPAAKPAVVPGQPIKVAEAPAFLDVDWTKTPDSLWLSGKAYLKNGQYVTYH